MAEKKKFIDVEVPILNRDIRVLGTVKELTGRTIKLDLARQMRGKGVIITFQIFDLDEKLVAIPKRIELVKSYLTRIIRKRTDIVEDSFLAHCADLRATVKPFLITRKKVSKAVRRSLRNVAREFLLNYIKEKNYDDICNEILDGSLQKEMLPKLKKIYPLAFCDIRIFETKDIMKVDLASIVAKTEIAKEKEEPKEGTNEEYIEEVEEETEKPAKKKADAKKKVNKTKDEEEESNAIEE